MYTRWRLLEGKGRPGEDSCPVVAARFAAAGSRRRVTRDHGSADRCLPSSSIVVGPELGPPEASGSAIHHNVGNEREGRDFAPPGAGQRDWPIYGGTPENDHY